MKKEYEVKLYIQRAHWFEKKTSMYLKRKKRAFWL